MKSHPGLVQQVQDSVSFHFIMKDQAILIKNQYTTGKSYLASAIGHQACLLGFKVYYANTAKLMSILKLAKADDSQLRELGRIETGSADT